MLLSVTDLVTETTREDRVPRMRAARAAFREEKAYYVCSIGQMPSYKQESLVQTLLGNGDCMIPLQTIIATLIASIVSSAIALSLTHRKQRQLEAYKASLQVELERSKLQIQNDLQIKFFEYQTKFSLLHQRQAEVIKAFYGLLADTNENIRHVVSPFFNITDSTDSKHADTTRAKYKALAE